MLDLREKQEVLSSSSIFRGLSDEALEGIAGRAGQIDVETGEILVREGEPGDSVYIVVSGTVEVMKGSVVLSVLSRGDMVGEMAVLTGDVRSATVKARTDTVVLFLKAKALKLLIQKTPDIAFGIFGVLAARLRNAVNYIQNVVERKSSVAELEVVDGPDEGRVFEMVSDRMEIRKALGSLLEDQARCALTPPSGTTEERAGEVVYSDGAFFLHAVDASSPVILNGQEVVGSVELNDDDIITSVGSKVKFSRKDGNNGN